jgi:hypothetical protein
MAVTFLGIFCFLFSLAVHILFWKFLPRSRRLRLLAPVFLFSFFVFINLIYFSAKFIPALASFLPRDVYSAARILLLFLLFTAAYIATYPGLEIDSPSLALVYFIYCSGSEGFDKQRLASCVGDDVLVIPRINDLVSSGLVIKKDGRYLITSLGKVFIGIFIFYRRSIKLPKGG